MINIGIYADYRFVSSATPTGVSKHMVNMVKGLSSDKQFSVSGIVANDQIDDMGDLSFLQSVVLPFPFKGARETWSLMNYPPIDRWGPGLDWVYCPNHDLVAKRKVKYAVTFHGAPDIDPEFEWPRSGIDRVVSERKKRFYSKAVVRADLIIVVSAWLKNHMVEHFGAARDRVVVVGNGVSKKFFQTGTNRLQSKNHCDSEEVIPYLLVVGGLNHIDGGDYVVEVAKKMKMAGSKFRIKLAGSHHETKLLNEASETGYIDLLGHVSEKEICKLMSNASLLYMPSRYESFGMTAVEAMAAGCPVAVSRAAALPEVVGDCGVYIDPENASDAFDCVNQVIDNKYPLDMCQRAYERAKSLYTWDRCVDRLRENLVLRS